MKDNEPRITYFHADMKHPTEQEWSDRPHMSYWDGRINAWVIADQSFFDEAARRTMIVSA